LETPTGLRLSPAYDIVNTAFYDGFDQTLALSIDGKKLHLDQVTRQTLEAFGRSVGLPELVIATAFRDVRNGVRRAAKILTPPAGEPPGGFVTRFSEIVSGACLRILGEQRRLTGARLWPKRSAGARRRS
jgi:serine/threonine-protein kinase HipA